MKERTGKPKDSKREARPESGLGGVILERLRRINSLPLHTLDWQTEFVLHHFLGGRKRTS